MKLPGRIELWLLLALIVAGLVFVFASRHRDEDPAGAGDSAGSSASEEAPLKLHRCVLKRDSGAARLDLELRVRNSAAEKLVLQAPVARLLSATGREIAGFYLPFEPQPEVAAGSTQDVLVRYWLEAADLQGALRFELNGRSIEVKGARPFDLNSMNDLEEKTFNAGEW
jgi:hypothetical protein